MGTVNLGQVAALIQSVEVEDLPDGAMPTVRNVGSKANAKLVFGIPSIKNRLINILKNGYIQWPGMPSPLEDVSLHFEGYSWYEVNYDGNFFRAKGRNAKAFSAKKLTKEQIKNGAYVFQDDEQGDAIRNILSKVFDNSDAVMFWGDAHANLGAFQTKYKEGNWKMFFSPVGEEWLAKKHLILDISKADSVTVAEENRPRGLTFTIWALVKDE